MQNAESSSYGGAIYVVGGHLELKRCLFRNNAATAGNCGGGVVFLDSKDHESSAIISDCTFDSNSAAAHGGAIVADYPGSSATIIGCTFKNNTAVGGGGAVSNAGGSVGGSTTISDCIFKGGTGSHPDSVLNRGDGTGNLTFVCPSGTTGAPVAIKIGEELEAEQLPPAKEVTHCVPRGTGKPGGAGEAPLL